MTKAREIRYNFKIIENDYFDWNTIKEEFTQDFLYSRLRNDELKKKYDLTRGEFNTCCEKVLSEYNLSRRPHYRERCGLSNYFYKSKYSVIIQKKINGVNYYIGSVPTVKIALKIVELCKKASWDIDVCKQIVERWNEYVE